MAWHAVLFDEFGRKEGRKGKIKGEKEIRPGSQFSNTQSREKLPSFMYLIEDWLILWNNQLKFKKPQLYRKGLDISVFLKHTSFPLTARRFSNPSNNVRNAAQS